MILPRYLPELWKQFHVAQHEEQRTNNLQTPQLIPLLHLLNYVLCASIALLWVILPLGWYSHYLFWLSYLHIFSPNLEVPPKQFWLLEGVMVIFFQYGILISWNWIIRKPCLAQSVQGTLTKGETQTTSDGCYLSHSVIHPPSCLGFQRQRHTSA
jgi:hypothetical protein